MKAFADLRDWLSRTPLRLYAAIILLTLVLVAVFSLRADKLLREEIEKKELSEGLETANISAYFLEEHFQQTAALLQSIVQRESFASDWKRRDARALARQMAQAQDLQSDFALMSVYDVDGAMSAVDPQNTNLIGTNFAFRDWYKGVTKAWSPYHPGTPRRDHLLQSSPGWRVYPHLVRLARRSQPASRATKTRFRHLVDCHPCP